ncbi:MAG TPA: tripartite tricarboxylate transporter TctB family protein [Dongiaceae bacterium]|nr:tripartite tricarboxylate transporter TctB family protein [Dongiaceae bacterium]
MDVKRGAAAEIALGAGVAALGAFILYETTLIRVSPIYSKVGPGVIPTIVGIILLGLGLIFVWQSWRGKPAAAEGLDAPGSLLDTPGTGGAAADWRALAMIALGLVVQIVLLDPRDAPLGLDQVFASLGAPLTAIVSAISGFIPTAAFLFLCVAIGFGSRRYLRDLIIGILLATAAYVGFVHGLGLPLPAGAVGGLL